MKEVFEFEVQYFKPGGKFYAQGRLDFECGYIETGSGGKLPLMCEAVEKLQQLKRAGKLPGLVEGGGKEFHIYVNHPDGFPHLIPA